MSYWTPWFPFTRGTVNRSPEHGGVYELAFDGYRCDYPLGWSSTVYYGKADNDLASRLRKHFYGYGSIVVDDLLADRHRLKVRWWNTWELPRIVEYSLIERFEWKFGSRPIANLRR